MIETMGRKAKLEKILFKDTTVMSSYEADWSRDVVKHNLISGVSRITQSLGMEIVIVTAEAILAWQMNLIMPRWAEPRGIQ